MRTMHTPVQCAIPFIAPTHPQQDANLCSQAHVHVRAHVFVTHNAFFLSHTHACTSARLHQCLHVFVTHTMPIPLYHRYHVPGDRMDWPVAV